MDRGAGILSRHLLQRRSGTPSRDFGAPRNTQSDLGRHLCNGYILVMDEKVSDPIQRKYALEIQQAKALGNNYFPDVWGRFPWDRSEHRGKPVHLSKKGLGDFVYHILKNGGDLTNFFMLARIDRASVFVRVWLTLQAKAKIEAETAYRFDPPPTIKLA
jgi:hypothetical protein